LAAAILALAACDNKPTVTTSTPGEKVDSALSSAKQAQSDTTEALTDAAITARVKAQLATDPSLSALKVDVETTNGHVRLKGTAPDATARDRATTMASAIKGVLSVDNLLTVDKKS
jgi:osmotically-inducible protein OsmY